MHLTKLLHIGTYSDLGDSVLGESGITCRHNLNDIDVIHDGSNVSTNITVFSERLRRPIQLEL